MAPAATTTRGRKPKLTREQIAAAGLRLIADEGVAGFNLRALADRLHISVMGLYRYVADKDELLDAIVAHGLAPVTETDGIEAAMRRFYAVLLEHPGLAELCASRFPGAAVDDLRAHLRATGAGQEQLRALTSFVMGSAIVAPAQAGPAAEHRAAFEYGLTRLLEEKR